MALADYEKFDALWEQRAAELWGPSWNVRFGPWALGDRPTEPERWVGKDEYSAARKAFEREHLGGRTLREIEREAASAALANLPEPETA